MSSQLLIPPTPSVPTSETEQPRHITPQAAFAQACAEAWAVVHCAERQGHRDISDALHQAIEQALASGEGAAALPLLEAAREHALACLDAHGALTEI